MPESSCAPEFEIVGWLLAQIIRNDAHGRTRIIRKNNLEKRMLAPSRSLSFSDAAPHPLVNRLSNDYREYMYLFLGCQQSILVRHLGVSFSGGESLACRPGQALFCHARFPFELQSSSRRTPIMISIAISKLTTTGSPVGQPA
jgi:hypothetical protein